MRKNHLSFEELSVGMPVVDNEGTTGKITLIENIHNIHVSSEQEGLGIYCLDDTCESYDPLFKPNTLDL